MKVLFLIFFLFAIQSLSAQSIRGVVRDQGSGLPIPYANVFVNNTTQGIATDEEGEFRLSGSFPSEIELVASFVGYVTQVKTLYLEGKNEIEVIFDLKFNESNLSEIELKAKRDKSWERNFEKFKEVFLAVSDDPYKSQIEILNPWVVNFEKVKGQMGPNYLSATAQEPLKIINHALGYEIEYYLQDFRLTRTGSQFFGQVYYTQLKPTEKQEFSSWEEARQSNYLGSLQHLNASILLNTPDSVYFGLFRTKPNPLDHIRTNSFLEELNKTIIPVAKDSILRRPRGDGTFRIFLPEKIEVHHLGKEWLNDYYSEIYHPISWIQAPSGYYDIDRNGILLNPTQLVLSGYLGRKRVARTLPLDFNPTDNVGVTENLIDEVLAQPELKLNRLREKVWLTTSKPYFYPGETAWVGGMVLYQDSFLADSLSRVVYIDLLKENKEIVQSATFAIQKGKISGALELPSDILPGDYVLRAYTQWNRNFPTMEQYVAPFIIMESGFIPEISAEIKELFPTEIDVKADIAVIDSLNYRLMNLKLNFLDEFENPIDGEFVLSVSDAEKVHELAPKSSLEQAMDWLDEKLHQNFESDLTYPVEYGISVQGKFIPDNRRQLLNSPITIVRGDLEEYGQVTSDSSGFFWATGLSFQDTSQIAISALDEKLRPFGSVELLSFNKPPFPSNFPKLDYKKSAIETNKYSLDITGDYILLEEFVKEETNTKNSMADENYGYGDPTQEVGPKVLEKLPWEQIFGILRINPQTGKIANYNFGENVSGPLLIIDGSAIPFLSGSEVINIISSFEPSQLLSVKIYSDNIRKSVFGMAGYSGIIMVETKKGSRTSGMDETKFNSEGFQFFSIPGFTSFPEFPKSPPSDQSLSKKPTVYWDPMAETINGQYKVQVKVPYGINQLRIKIEGKSLDGEVIFKVFEIER